MRIGVIVFEDGACDQGWNPSSMSPSVRRSVVKMLREIASHMAKGEFAVGPDEYVKRPYKRRRANLKSK